MGEVQEMDKLLGVFRLTLAGEERTVAKKPIKDSYEFRRVAGHLFAPIAGKLIAAQGKAKDESSAEAAFGEMLPDLIPFLLSDGLDKLISLPALYDPALKEAQDAASDDELIDAGVEVLALAFPLLQRMLGAVPRLIAAATGSASQT